MLWLLMLAPMVSFATHNRAGEITYTHRPDLGPNTYEIEIQTCTKISANIDRPYLKIRFGDEPIGTPANELDSLPRVEIIPIPGQDAQLSHYYGIHVYSGPGIYELEVEDENRNSDIVNILGSVSVSFCVRTTLVISPITGHNNSVQLLNPPKERACIWQPWIHNPSAYDPDGDSLYFSLIRCRGDFCQEIESWELPDAATSYPDDIFTINPNNGDVSWIVPPLAGEYNIAILIEEFRDGIFVGSVVRDMQIDVITCPNVAPEITPMPDYCVEAGTNISFFLSASDDGDGALEWSATGGPLSEVQHEATFNNTTREFSWGPECEEVRAQPYIVNFQVTDNGNIPLTDIETVEITVVAPPVRNPDAEAVGNTMELQWDPTICANIFSPTEAQQVRYLIYRRNGLYGFDPDLCELGVPAYTGYSYIGQTTGVNNTTFIDTDVYYGGVFCYMVATVWPDGAVSYASEEFCDTINKDVPVLTKASVGITDLALGVDTVWWSPPTELDTLQYPGPYRYQLYTSSGNDQPNTLIYTSDESPYLIWGDTTFIHSNINTQDRRNNYRIEILSNGAQVSSGPKGSTPFLVLTPADNRMQLDINENVPWINYSFYIYRKAPGEADFSLLETVATLPFVDTGLVNNQVYCYKVMCLGTYNQAPFDSLVNWSQEACAQPYDQTPPCPPTLTVDADCNEQISTLVWTYVDRSCAEDVTAYNIYYAATPDAPRELIASIGESADTIYVHNLDGLLNSIAGCFSVTALDSLNLWPDGNYYQNESVRSNEVCVDNCPIYFLPNIFTPNGDNHNDVMLPVAKRFIKDIDLKIFDRWGTLVFETTDADIQWNGAAKDSGELVSDGVYYYTVSVNTIRLQGIVTEKLSGYVRVNNATKLTPTD